ncbi:MAG: NAD(P)-dependent oxidoreductase [Syntrophorhabdales bacterium]|jgi:UDP-glucose 4-epimerase
MILVTGGGGFVGVNAARCLADKGEEVMLLQRRSRGVPPLLEQYWGKQVREATGSILELPFLFGLMKEFPIDGIVHAAFDSAGIDARGGGMSPSSGRTLYDVVQIGINGTINMLELGRLFALRRIIFISSVDTYRGWPQDSPVWREDAPLPPVSFSPIGNNKKAGEQVCFLYAKAYGLSVVSLRVGRVYGPGATHNEPIRIMVENAVAGSQTDLSNVPSDSRGHTVYARDAGLAICHAVLAASPKEHIYNVADGRNPTMAEVAEIVRDMVPGARITLGAPTGVKPSHTGVDVSRIGEEWGLAPRSVREGIAAYVEWLRKGRYE